MTRAVAQRHPSGRRRRLGWCVACLGVLCVVGLPGLTGELLAESRQQAAVARAASGPTVGSVVSVGSVGSQQQPQPDGGSEDEPLGGRAPIVAVLRGPGSVGVWLVDATGRVDSVGTAIGLSFVDQPELTATVIGARLGAPGALGVWLELADGSEVALGDPGPEVFTGDERSLGWLTGVATRQLLSGAWWPRIGRACVAELPLPVRIGQTIMTMLSESGFGAAVDEARRHRIAGIALSGDATEHIWRRIDELQQFANRIPLLFAVDEEGGRVQRLRYVLDRLEPAAEQSRLDSGALEVRMRRHGQEMAALGFTMSFAPVLDVGGGPGIGDRAFSDDPAAVAEYGLAAVRGLHASGVVPVVKHFPGHGAASADTHDRLAVTAPLEDLRSRDLVPFVAAAGTPAAVMVGHLDVPGLTDGMPASLSSAAITDLLRNEIGHSGLVVTDSLTMGAISRRWSAAQAAVLALTAGADLVLVGGLDDAADAFSAVEQAVADGVLDDARLNDAVTAVLQAKRTYACDLVGRVGVATRLLHDPTIGPRPAQPNL